VNQHPQLPNSVSALEQTQRKMSSESALEQRQTPSQLLRLSEHSVYAGTIDLSEGDHSCPVGLTWIQGRRNAAACKRAGIPTMRAFIGFTVHYPRFQGVVIDAADTYLLQAEICDMQRRAAERDLQQQRKTRLETQHVDAVWARLQADVPVRQQVVIRAKAAANIEVDLDPTLSRRVRKFESGLCLLELFHDLSAGCRKATKQTLLSMFPSDQVPSMRLTRYELLFLYVTTCCGNRFDISERERAASVRRAEQAVLLMTLPPNPTNPTKVTVTPSDLESFSWKDRTIKEVCGLPWIVRSYILDNVSCSRHRPWKLQFIADRMSRQELLKKIVPSTFTTTLSSECDFRFVNTTACWFRKDPFSQIPNDILDIICPFMSCNDLSHIMESSRSLALSCCRVYRTSKLSIGSHVCCCGQRRATACVQNLCATCCTSNECRRHRARKRKRSQ
jgi:hypothetical protein